PNGSPRARRASPLMSSHLPVTMLANGHKAPLFRRPLTTRCLGLEGRRKGTARQVTSRCPRSSIASMLATTYMHLNFHKVDLLELIVRMSALTGKNFLVDEKVRGQVTLIAPQPVTRAEAYHLLLTALAMQGFTVVARGPLHTIVPSRDAKISPL